MKPYTSNPRQEAREIDKATWILAGVSIVLAILGLILN